MTLPITTQEIRIVDAQGNLRILLSGQAGEPAIRLLCDDGKPAASIALDVEGRPAIKLVNPHPDGPDAAIEIDDKGAHVLFQHPGGASSYLFLNNAGGSGVVLIDTAGKRRFNATVSADGTSVVERFDDEGKSIA